MSRVVCPNGWVRGKGGGGGDWFAANAGDAEFIKQRPRCREMGEGEAMISSLFVLFPKQQ